MDEQIITECPGCHARFRVSVAQLEIAEGKVRCGACLKVFAAADNLAETNHASVRLTQPAPLSSIMKPATAPTPTAEAPLTVPPSQLQQKNSVPVAKPPLAERARRAAEQAAKATQTQPPQLTPVTATAQATVAQPDVDDQSLTADLHAEPIAISTRHPEDHALANAGWLFLGALACLGLLLQYTWFERATLGNNPALRPAYDYVCGLVSCDLDSRAVGMIRTQHLIIRPHPQFSDAIVADIQLQNNAAFAQPYPALTLIFRDLQGSLVARRTFQPRSYLDMSRIDANAMPAGVPVEIHMQLTDPGPKAVSYHLSVEVPQRASAGAR